MLYFPPSSGFSFPNAPFPFLFMPCSSFAAPCRPSHVLGRSTEEMSCIWKTEIKRCLTGFPLCLPWSPLSPSPPSAVPHLWAKVCLHPVWQGRAWGTLHQLCVCSVYKTRGFFWVSTKKAHSINAENGSGSPIRYHATFIYLSLFCMLPLPNVKLEKETPSCILTVVTSVETASKSVLIVIFCRFSAWGKFYVIFLGGSQLCEHAKCSQRCAQAIFNGNKMSKCGQHILVRGFCQN